MSFARRFFMLQVMLPAAVLNALVNSVVGPLVYRHATVPSFGPDSVGLDCLIGAFLIGGFSWLGLAGAGGLEARAGRVRGRGWRAPWLKWLLRHRVLGSIGFGFAVVIAAGLPALWALSTWFPDSMPRGEFLLGKVGYAVVVGVLAALAVAWLGAAVEPPVVFHAPTPVVPSAMYPFQPGDKGCVAITDVERGCSITPTWQLVVRGVLDEAHLRAALTHLVVRYPSLRMKAQPLDGVPPLCRQLRYVEAPNFQVDEVFECIDLRAAPERWPAVERELKNRPLDLFTHFPVTLSWVRLGDDSSRLVFRQHHAIADGRAFIGLLIDFARLFESVRQGESLTHPTPVGRRDEAEALGARGLQRTRWTWAGHLLHLRAIARELLTPTTPLRQNRGIDYTGDNETLHWRVDAAQFAKWKAAHKQLGVGLNSYLAGAYALANRTWHVEAGERIGRIQAILAMETRPRDPNFASFANHLGSFVASLPLQYLTSLAELAQATQRQVEAQRAAHEPQKRLLSQMQVTSVMTLADIHRILYEQKRPLTNLDFSNLIALDFPPLGGLGWSVDEVLITTPVVPRSGVVLTVIRYREQVVFNLNFKTSVVDAAHAHGLLEHFKRALS